MIRIFARTDSGKVRKGNEDSFLVIDTTNEKFDYLPQVRETPFHPHGIILMVSDGMGGAAAGEVASKLAVNSVRQEMKFNDSPASELFTNQLDQSLQKANQVISDHAKQHPEMRGMGATATVVGILNGNAYIGQIGDSRAYLIRQNKIHQKTTDQSFVNQLVEAGKITEEEAEQHPRRNVILQALGNQANMDVVLTEVALCEDDYLLICSDGLSGMVRKEELLEIIRATQGIDNACHKMVELANERGGHDNITVILAHFSDDALGEPANSTEELELTEIVPNPAPKAKPEPKQEKKTKPETGLKDFFGKFKKKYLMLSLLTLAAACCLWFGFQWYDNYQNGSVEKKIAMIQNSFLKFKDDHKPLINSLENSADTLGFISYLGRSAIALSRNQPEYALLLADSAETVYSEWWQRASQLIALKNGDRTYLEALIREIWFANIFKLRLKEAEIHPGTQAFSEQDKAYLKTLPYQELANKIQADMNKGFWDTHAFILKNVNILFQNFKDEGNIRDTINSKLNATTQFHRIAMDKIFDLDPQEVTKGFEREEIALILLEEIKRKWLIDTLDMESSTDQSEERSENLQVSLEN